MKVEQWISYSDTEYEENDLGGMGGWFNSQLVHGKRTIIDFSDPDNPKPIETLEKDCIPHTFEDYLNNYEDKEQEYIKALKEEIISNNIQLTGQNHQYSHNGMPVFSDGTCSRFTYRAWGDLMAAIYTSEDNPLSYMEYYM